jgi:hypothetical protein
MSGRPSTFTVTAAGQRVNLGISGAARASFTVTNTSTQTLKGRMLTRPGDPASPDWFSVLGESVRDFGPNEAEQIVVQLQVPQTASPGSYTFRLDAVSAVDPDEDFTEGPSVAFDVEATPPKKRKFPWVPWWVVGVAGGVVLLIIIAVVVFLIVRGGEETRVISSGNVTMPAGSFFDVDTGTVPPAGGPAADLQWSVFGDMLPEHNAGLLNIGVVNLNSIDAEQLSTLIYRTSGLRGDLLVTGDVFAVRSTDGNFAKVKVVSPGNQIGIQWVAYQDPGD